MAAPFGAAGMVCLPSAAVTTESLSAGGGAGMATPPGPDGAFALSARLSCRADGTACGSVELGCSAAVRVTLPPSAGALLSGKLRYCLLVSPSTNATGPHQAEWSMSVFLASPPGLVGTP